MEFVLVENDDDDDEERGSEPGRCQDAEYVAKVRDEQMNEMIKESFF